jgi:glyoxylase-like metal-dependent hydrolase (beta-lactamase superfamily II)
MEYKDMEDRQFGRIRFVCGENGGRYPFNHSLYIEGDNTRVIIDPASDLEKLKRLQNNGGVDLVWLSHWHGDHVHYMHLFADCPKWISARDFPPLTDIEIFLDWYGLKEAYRRRMSRKPRRSEGTRKRSLRLRSGRLYCLDRRSVSGASQGNSEASAADRLNVSAARGQPISVITGKK